MLGIFSKAFSEERFLK